VQGSLGLYLLDLAATDKIEFKQMLQISESYKGLSMWLKEEQDELG
jgi:hypothetical protein